MLNVNELVGFNSAAEMSYEFLSVNVNTSNSSSYTFSSVNLGTPRDDRDIFICVNNLLDGTARTISSATIGGVSGNITTLVTSRYHTLSVIHCRVPSGSTGDVVLSLTGTADVCSITVAKVIGYDLTNSKGSDGGTASSISSLDITADIKNYNIGFVFCTYNQSGISTRYMAAGVVQNETVSSINITRTASNNVDFTGALEVADTALGSRSGSANLINHAVIWY